MKVTMLFLALVLTSIIGLCQGLCGPPPFLENPFPQTYEKGVVIPVYCSRPNVSESGYRTIFPLDSGSITCLSNGSWAILKPFFCNAIWMEKCPGLRGYYLGYCHDPLCCTSDLPNEDCLCVSDLSIGAVVGTVTAGIYIVCFIIGVVFVLLRHYATSSDDYFHPDYRKPIVH